MPKQRTPREYGLPEKFTVWRPGQEEGLHLLKTAKERHILGCMPTGWGKSAAIVADALDSGEPSAIVTHSKGLQDQYFQDFKTVGMVDLRGRNNYACQMKEGYTCEDGYAARCVYKGTPMCGASKAELKASLSYLVVTNYSKWTSNKRFGQGLSHIKRVYFDEAHNAPNAIADAVRVELNHKEIEDGLRVSFPRGHDSEDMNVWRQWASTTKGYADEALKEAYKRIQDANDPKPAWVRHYNHMRNLCRKLTVLTTARAVDWIVDQTETGYVFDPIRPGRYAEPYLFLQVPKVIMISATIREKTGFMCHISRENMKFQEFPSDFDPKRSPIYYVPTMRVDSNANDLGQLWAVLDRVMSRRRDRKGVVHSTSFERQREIRDRSRFASAMILNKKGQPVADAMEEFFQAGPGTTFISPSVCEGYDFKQDKARWQFMCKVPFEPPSKIVKAREADDKEYRGYKAMQALVQSFGRGMREHTDWCENFICDMHMDWFYPKYSHLAPKSFNKFIKAVSILPPPMNY